MKNIEKGTIKYLIVLIITIAICCIIIYPLFDLVFLKFITNSKFVYSVKSHIVQPIITSVVAGSVIWVSDKKKK